MRSVQLPGRETRLREMLHHRVHPLARLVADALVPYLDRPFAFFGHSMGALLCFETARELRRRRSPMPAHLFVSAKSAPQLPLSRPPVFDLPDAEFLAQLRRLYEPPEEAWEIPELLSMLLPIMRADMAVCDAYVYLPEPPLDCPILAFGGDLDREAPLRELEAWRDQTSSSFSLQVFPGGHFFLNERPAQLQGLVAAELSKLAAGAVRG